MRPKVRENYRREGRVRKRKGVEYATVLFSDLSGYTALSEKLDPEELKEITRRIFGKISNVVVGYEGFVEKFVGDIVVALFDIPKAYEDDPIKAIRAVKEKHDLVDELW